MPIYEFRCASCDRVTSVFTRRVESPAGVTCEHCGSADTSRAISTFAFSKSESSSFDLGDLGGMGGMDDMGMGGMGGMGGMDMGMGGMGGLDMGDDF